MENFFMVVRYLFSVISKVQYEISGKRIVENIQSKNLQLITFELTLGDGFSKTYRFPRTLFYRLLFRAD